MEAEMEIGSDRKKQSILAGLVRGDTLSLWIPGHHFVIPGLTEELSLLERE